MANDGKIYITITDDRGGSGGRSGATGSGANKRLANFNNVADQADNEDSKFKKFATHEAIHFIKSETMQLINQYVGTIGTRTGNYVAQQNAQVALGIANKGIGIGAVAVAGFMAAGPLGAALGAGVSSLLTMTNMVFQQQQYYRQIRYNNSEISFIRQRAGLDINNGSR